MADIKEEMSAIERAYKGKEIKEAILSALDKVNETNGTARFLDGHGDSEFLTQEELDQFTPLDDTPTQGSEKGISSGKIFTYLEKMGKAIDDVNGVSSSSGGTSETIKEKLEYLNETKRAIRKELIDKGVPVDPDTDTFRSYAEKIGQIELEANLDVQPLEITSNGTYEADEGIAYNPVTANVAFDLVPKTITKNGTYKAESEGHDGYSEVDVSASSALTTKTVSGDDFPADMEPLEYKASDEGEDIMGYSEITVDLTEKVMEKDPVVLDPESAGEEYVYDAKDDDVYGYSKFTVMINDTSQFFTVKFMSDGEVVYVEDHVEKGDSCSYKGRVLEKEGYVFSGWNPQPINVERNLTCVAKWVEDEKAQKEAGGSSGGGQTIDKMNWDDIQAHPDRINPATSEGGGDVKRIYWMPFSACNREFRGGYADAHCIARGENGTNTTWAMDIDIGALTNNINGSSSSAESESQKYWFPMLAGGSPSGGTRISALSYTSSPLAEFASSLATSILSCKGDGYEGQSDLSFASVSKKTMVYDGVSIVPKTDSFNGLWLFSAGEMGSSGHEGAHSVKGYPYFGPYSERLARTMAYTNITAGTADESRYGIKAGTLTAEAAYLIGCGVSNMMPHSNDGMFVSAGYIYTENEGYTNAYKGISGVFGALYSVTSSGSSKIGAGRSLGTVTFGFCL